MERKTQTPARPQLAHGVRDFIERERQRILSSCTSCGKCFEACPMPAYMHKKDASPAQVTAGILELLRSGSSDEVALDWVRVCIRSGECVDACPENVNPKMMMRLAKMAATGGLGGQKLIQVKEDRDYYPRIRAFAQLQLTEQELKEWME